MHERRRFTDIMDEEIDDERKTRISRYDPETRQHVPRRLRYELGTRADAVVEAETLLESKREGQVSGPPGGGSREGSRGKEGGKCNRCREGDGE